MDVLRRAGMTTLAATVAVALVAGSCHDGGWEGRRWRDRTVPAPAVEAIGEPGFELGNGFRVAPGSRLVAFFPYTDPEDPDSGWLAFLQVEANPLEVWNLYADQAAAAGLGTFPVPQACAVESRRRFDRLGGVREDPVLLQCSSRGQLLRAETPFVDLRLRRSAPTWVSYLAVRLVSAGRHGESGRDRLEVGDSLQTGDQTPRRVRRFAAIPASPVPPPSPGDAFGEYLDGRRQRRLTLVEGSELVASRAPLFDCDDGSSAVLRVRGDPAKVVKSYERQFTRLGFELRRATTGSEHANGRRWTASSISAGDGHLSAEAFQPSAGGATFLLLARCFDD